jgi:hypothetical protein
MFALTIHSNKQERFKVGDEIRIHVSRKNTSEKPVPTAPTIPTAETSYKVFVEDADGHLAKETPFGRTLRTGKGEHGEETVTVAKSGLFRYLQPGETMNEEIVLNRLYDLSTPGRYTVYVQLRGDLDGSGKSNKLTITLVEASNEPVK